MRSSLLHSCRHSLAHALAFVPPITRACSCTHAATRSLLHSRRYTIVLALALAPPPTYPCTHARMNAAARNVVLTLSCVRLVTCNAKKLKSGQHSTCGFSTRIGTSMQIFTCFTPAQVQVMHPDNRNSIN